MTTSRSDREPLRERVAGWLEDLRVRWFMLDHGAKQAVLLAVLYGAYTLLDIGGALIKARLTRETTV